MGRRTSHRAPVRGDGAGSFHRTANRHDYALTPPRDTLLDLPDQADSRVSIGKVRDLFAGEA